MFSVSCQKIEFTKKIIIIPDKEYPVFFLKPFLGIFFVGQHLLGKWSLLIGDLDLPVRKHYRVCAKAVLLYGALISGVAYLVLDACHSNLFVLRFAFSCHKCCRRTFVTFPFHFYFNNSPNIYGMYTHILLFISGPPSPFALHPQFPPDHRTCSQAAIVHVINLIFSVSVLPSSAHRCSWLWTHEEHMVMEMGAIYVCSFNLFKGLGNLKNILF